jgi:hypothetical protein
VRQRDALARQGRMNAVRLAGPVWRAVARQVDRVVRLHRSFEHELPQWEQAGACHDLDTERMG